MRRVSRIVLLCLFGLILLYLGCGSVVYLLARHRQGNRELSYADVILPHRWPRYRISKGQTMIRQAVMHFESGNFPAGLHHLRAGLARAPADRDGRLLLARWHAETGRDDLAREVLQHGLKYHVTDATYVRLLFGHLLEAQADGEVIRLSEQIQQSPGVSADVIGLARLSAATAAYHRGNHDAAEKILAATPGLPVSRDGRLLGAKIQWDRGYGELALHQLRALADDLPGDEEIYALRSAWLRKNGRFDEARQLTLVFQLARPDSALPRIDMLQDHARDQNETAWRQTADEILRLHAHDQKILLALGDFAASTGDPLMAREVQARLPAGSRIWQNATLLHLEALVVAGRYDEALIRAEELEHLQPPLDGHLLTLSQGLRAIVHYGGNDPESGRLALNRFLAAPHLRAGSLLAIANRLAATGARQPARDLLARATALDPLNQPALCRLIELDLAQGGHEELPGRLQRLLSMRKPPRELLRRASAFLGSDRFIFSRERTPVLRAIGPQLAPTLPPAGPPAN